MVFVCDHCLRAVSVFHEGTMPLVEAHETFECPWCKEGTLAYAPALGKAARETCNGPGSMYTYTVMPEEEFFRAVRGMGLPGEAGASPTLVEDMFRHGRITAIDIEPVPDPLKTVVHSIQLGFPDGGRFTLHLGSSTKGAIIYRVEENHGSRGNPQRAAGPHRDEAGPGASQDDDLGADGEADPDGHPEHAGDAGLPRL